MPSWGCRGLHGRPCSAGAKPVPKPCQEQFSSTRSAAPPSPALGCPRALPSLSAVPQEQTPSAPASEMHPARSASGQVMRGRMRPALAQLDQPQWPWAGLVSMDDLSVVMDGWRAGGSSGAPRGRRSALAAAGCCLAPALPSCLAAARHKRSQLPPVTAVSRQVVPHRGHGAPQGLLCRGSARPHRHRGPEPGGG